MTIMPKIEESTMKKGTRLSASGSSSSVYYPGKTTFIPKIPPMMAGGMNTIVTKVRASMMLFSLKLYFISSLSTYCANDSSATSMFSRALSKLKFISLIRLCMNLILFSVP